VREREREREREEVEGAREGLKKHVTRPESPRLGKILCSID
jgi:hypothetical protein